MWPSTYTTTRRCSSSTSDVKKGSHTVGVQRQYTGTAGRIENSQVAVYLVYAGGRGHAAVDRELYIPRSWTDRPDRCQAAGLDPDTAFATKPEGEFLQWPVFDARSHPGAAALVGGVGQDGDALALADADDPVGAGRGQVVGPARQGG